MLTRLTPVATLIDTKQHSATTSFSTQIATFSWHLCNRRDAQVERHTQSRRPGGASVALAPPNKAPSPPKLKREILWISGVFVNFWMSSPHGQTQSLTAETQNFLATLLPATWTWKARHEMKIYEQWQGTKKRARVNNLVKWDRPFGGGTNIQSKQARILRYES